MALFCTLILFVISRASIDPDIAGDYGSAAIYHSAQNQSFIKVVWTDDNTNNSRPNATGTIGDVLQQNLFFQGSVDFPDDTEYIARYYQDDHTIYWDGERGNTFNTWTKIHSFSPTLSPTYSPTYKPSFSPTVIPTDNPTFNPTPTPQPTLVTSSPIATLPLITSVPSTSIPTLLHSTLSPSGSPTVSTFKPTITITYIINTPTLSPQRDGQNDIETSTGNVMLSTETETYKQHNKKRAGLIVLILFSVTLIIILCGLIIYFLQHQCVYKREYKLISKSNRNMNDDFYVELIDPETHSTAGTPYGQITTALGTTKFIGESVSLPSVHSNDIDDQNINYNYATPTNEGNDLTPNGLTPNGLTPGDIEIENNEIDVDNCVESVDILQEKSTAGSFAQILNDNVMGVDLMMLDIVQDMDTDK